MGKNLIYLLIILLFSSNVSIKAQNYIVKEGTASFKAKMPLNSYIGKSDDLQGTIGFKDGTLTFSVPVKSIKTDNEKRDGHMYDLVKAEKKPNVVFEGKSDLYRKGPSGGLGCMTPDSFPIFDRFFENVYMIADANHGYKMIGVGELVAKEILGTESDLLKPFRFNRYEKGELHPTSNSPFPWS